MSVSTSAPADRGGNKPSSLELRALPPSDDTLIRASDMPSYVGIARQTLARWRHEGSGPRFVKLGGLIFYRAGDVRAWIAASARLNTVPILK